MQLEGVEKALIIYPSNKAICEGLNGIWLTIAAFGCEQHPENSLWDDCSAFAATVARDLRRKLAAGRLLEIEAVLKAALHRALAYAVVVMAMLERFAGIKSPTGYLRPDGSGLGPATRALGCSQL